MQLQTGSVLLLSIVHCLNTSYMIFEVMACIAASLPCMPGTELPGGGGQARQPGRGVLHQALQVCAQVEPAVGAQPVYSSGEQLTARPGCL